MGRGERFGGSIAAVAAMLAVAVLSAAGAAAVCPDVAPAPRHVTLVVSDGPVLLPVGSLAKGLRVNSSERGVGPTIVAKLGEELSIDVVNQASVGTSVHWHGQDLKNASWADGVEGISQRTIAPRTTFRYKFRAEPAGTFWYHSHTGMQYPDGLRGALIVQDPNDPYKGQYDEEFVMMLTDQNNMTGEEMLRGLQEGTAMMGGMGLCASQTSQDFSDAPFTTILTNGLGWAPDPATGRPAGASHVFRVERGKRYRFRAINGGGSWGLKVKVEGHGVDVIALDGASVRRTPAAGFVFTPGERVDFLLSADQPVGNYRILVGTLAGAASPAVLSYAGAGDPSALPPPQLQLGCAWGLPERGVLDLKSTALAGALAPHASTPRPPPRADKQMVLYLTNQADPRESAAAILGGGKDATAAAAAAAAARLLPPGVRPTDGCRLPSGKPSAYCWSVNWTPFEPPEGGTPALFPGARPAGQTYIADVPLGSVVDVALVNLGAMVHPFHSHGTGFWVLGAGNGRVVKADGSIDYSVLDAQALSAPLMRDTHPVAEAVPSGDGMGSGSMGGMAGGGKPMPPPAGGMAGGGKPMPPPAGGMAGSSKPMPPPAGGMAGGGKPTPPPPRGAEGMGGSGGGAKPAPAAQQTMAQMPGMGHRRMMLQHGSMQMTAATPPAASSSGPMPTGEPHKVAPPASAGAVPGTQPGYAVLRIKFDNPGVWAFHCHIDLHANVGMFLAFRVGPPAQWFLPQGATTCPAA